MPSPQVLRLQPPRAGVGLDVVAVVADLARLNGAVTTFGFDLAHDDLIPGAADQKGERQLGSAFVSSWDLPCDAVWVVGAETVGCHYVAGPWPRQAPLHIVAPTLLQRVRREARRL